MKLVKKIIRAPEGGKEGCLSLLRDVKLKKVYVQRTKMADDQVMELEQVKRRYWWKFLCGPQGGKKASRRMLWTKQT